MKAIRFYDDLVVLPKRKVPITEKMNNQSIRRWRGRIECIELESLNQQFDPFLQFIIGGDYQKEFIINAKGDAKAVETGTMGPCFKTQVNINIDKGQKVLFNTTILFEYEASYVIIAQERLHIEVRYIYIYIFSFGIGINVR